MASSSAAQQVVGAKPGVQSKGKKSILRQKKFIIGGAVILLAIGYLIFNAMLGSTQYYMTVAELKQKVVTLTPNEIIRVSGVVVADSIQSDPKNNTIRFQIYDRNGDPKNTLNVEYKGVVPDTFKPDADAIMDGTYIAGTGGAGGNGSTVSNSVAGASASGSNTEFVATSLMAKCPSKYTPAGN